ncbi:hypothetical protein ACO2Q8_26125 [Larkinella sp. VNQ87]|uniref:hypothetical protein n=1 Tax=Larkinella sp. VNQ87 TaxID=3400921 RepID=UPI003C040B6E
MEEEVLEDVLTDEDAMSVASDVESESTLSEEEVDQEEVASFKEKALQTASKFKDYVLDKVKSLTIEKVVMLGTGILLVYQLIEKHAEVADKGGKKVKLSAAIDGTRSVLVDKYEDTVRSVAIQTKNNTDLWNSLSPDIQKTIEAEIAMTGDIYWLTIAQDIMEQLAEMPIYDPTNS